MKKLCSANSVGTNLIKSCRRHAEYICIYCHQNFCINCMYLTCISCYKYLTCFWCGAKDYKSIYNRPKLLCDKCKLFKIRHKK